MNATKRTCIILINLLLILTLIVQAAVLASGKRENQTNAKTYLPLILNNEDVNLCPIIGKTTKLLSQQTSRYLTSLSSDGITYTFSRSTPELDQVAVGDVVVGDPSDAAPYGFLRKVTAVSATGGQIVLVTAATLEDAIVTGQAHLSKTVTPGDIQDSSFLEGVSIVAGPTAANKLGLSYDLDDVVLYDLDRNLGTTGDHYGHL